jgi:formamidopyrimidine-DNA glycosylase
MPELPEVESLAAFLRERAVGHAIARIDVLAISALKTYDPPIHALNGLTVTGVARYGKFLDLDVDGIHMVVHFALLGWLKWNDALPKAPMRPGGKNPVAMRVFLDDGSGFDLTEQGTKKGLAVSVVHAAKDVPGVADLGPDPLSAEFTPAALYEITKDRRTQIKGLLRSQKIIAGIGNAYSDEVLHAAKMSPFKIASSLTEEEVAALHQVIVNTLDEAVERARGIAAGSLKAEKKLGLRVHGKAGQKCPVCGDVIREVSFADSALQYCATCQTGGKPLADRRMSKLLKLADPGLFAEELAHLGPSVELTAVLAAERGVDGGALEGALDRALLGAAIDVGAVRIGRDRGERVGGELRAGFGGIRDRAARRVTGERRGDRLGVRRFFECDGQ